MSTQQPASDSSLLFNLMVGVMGLFVIALILILFFGRSTSQQADEEITLADQPQNEPSPTAPQSSSQAAQAEKAASDAEKAMEQGNTDAARKLLSKGLQTAPAHQELQTLEQKLKQKEAESAAQQEQLLILCDSAKRAAESEQWALAISNLESALAIKRTAELEQQLADARFGMYKKQALDYIDHGNLIKGRHALRQALQIKSDPELRTLLETIEAHFDPDDLQQSTTPLEDLE